MKSTFKAFLSIMMVLSLVLSFAGQQAQAAGKLIISEYIEGSGYNKAIEIYNPTSEAVDLSTYSLVNFVNGASETTGTVAELKLSGTLAPGDVYVISHQSAAAEILAQADLKTGSAAVNFNGDDTLVLFENYNATTKTGEVNDSIGQVGVDPGTAFGTTTSTLDMTLVRTAANLTGDTDIHNAYDPAAQFTALPKDTTSELGTFSAQVTPPAPEVPQAEYHVNVVRVVDGDTIKISPSIMGSDTIRYVNIDTSETYHLTSYDPALIDTDLNHNQKYHGEQAKKALNEMLAPGTPITVKVNPDNITDAYGRILGQVIRESDNLNTNLEQVKLGMASTYFIWPVANMDDYNMFQAAVAEAQANHLGIWQTEHPLKELAFEFRARYDKKGLQRYVGDSETKLYYAPEDFAKVPVERRIFFAQEEAIAQGYKVAPDTTLPTEPTVTPAKEMTIQEARTAGKGRNAIVTGTVTAIDGYNIYIQDETAGMVVRSKTVKPAIGDVITATGTTTEYYDLYQVETEDVKGTGQKTVQPSVTALDQIGEDTEAEYIAIEKVKVESVNTYNEYTVSDAAGHTFLVKTTQPLEIGATYDRIEGVVTYSFNAYKLLPTSITKVTEVPTTEAPTTEVPTTEAPTTEAPTTEVPTTEAPTTEAPTTEVPTTEAPTTEVPTTEVPAVQHDVRGFVFFDQNSNGKFDRPDRKLKNVKVDIYQNGQLVKTVKTDKEGRYSVTVNEGTYVLKFDAPGNLVETFANQTSDDLDSDIKDGKVTVNVTKDMEDVTAGFAKNIGKFRK
ncbi:thermonuclease family protein [Macrococcus brunensis]|uniref:thermonuclease family protein n=1 Tax=Macrococcus brunensis TaxID=198483 RepID=UPI001EEFD983|nr:thermonuclease family protein [Macrococcus brunensis]ULG74384.1 thermonuclease family protein [Macrococcus brunensis]